VTCVFLIPTVVALLILRSAAPCDAFCPPERLPDVRRVVHSQYGIPPKFVWGPEFRPHPYNINDGGGDSSSGPNTVGPRMRSTSSTIPPRREPTQTNAAATLPAAATETEAAAATPPAAPLNIVSSTGGSVPASRPTTPAELAKRFIELSQQRLKTIVVQGLGGDDENNSDGRPSMQDLYETTQKVKSAMKEKERLFGEIISQQRNQYVEVARQFRAWQAHYNHSLVELQNKAQQQEAELEQKSAVHETQLESMRSSYARQEEAAKSTIVRLAALVQQVKLESHRRNVETSARLQAQQGQLTKRIHDLETKLESQMAQAALDAAKHVELATQREDLQRELEEVQRDFADLVRTLEAQLSSERSLRNQERATAQQQLHAVSKKAAEDIEAARVALVKQHQAESEALVNECSIKQRALVEQLEQNAQAEQARLNYSLETARAQMLQLQSTYQAEAEQEQAKAARIQSTLQTEINAMESHIKQLQCEKADGETKRVKELREHCESLQRQLADVQQKYNASVASMESKHQSLVDELDRQKKIYFEDLNKERENSRLKLEAAYQQVQEVQETLGRGIKEKQEQFHAAVKALRDLSNQTETNLKANLQSLTDSMQHQRSEARGMLLAAQEQALAQQRQLQGVISEKDMQIQSLSRQAHQESDRAAEHEQKRAELEKELFALRALHENVQQMWEARYRGLEALLKKEQAIAAERLAAQEARTRQELEQAQLARAALETSLQEALKSKDTTHEDRVRLLTVAAQAKEKELVDELERLRLDWNQLKKESHKQLEEEREKTRAIQRELLSKIAEKEREAEEASTLAELESQKATEFLEKRRELEMELAKFSSDYDSALETWEQVTQTFEEARRDEQRAAVEYMAQKEADVVRQVVETLEDASKQKEWFEMTLLDRERQFSAQLEEVRTAARQREAELSKSVAELNQQLNDAQLKILRSASAESTTSSQPNDDWAAALMRKDEELDWQRQEVARHAQQVDAMSRQERELRNEMSQLRLLHAQSIAEMEARNARLVQSHEDEKREAALKIRQAVSTIRNYEAVLSSSLEHMGDLEGHLQDEVERLQRMVSTLQRRAVGP
jgi:hypothetical protein